MADHDLIRKLSVMGAKLISAQMPAAVPSLEGEFDPWGFGYCYGFIDAISQAGGLSEDSDFLLLLTVTFDEIAKGDGELKRGAELVEDALKQQHEPSFQQGVMQGGTDFMEYRKDQTAIPFGLQNHRGNI